MHDEPERSDARPAERRCPECGARAVRVLWGFPAGDPGPDVTLGGCDIVGDPPPRWLCRFCGWTGDRPATGARRS